MLLTEFDEEKRAVINPVRYAHKILQFPGDRDGTSKIEEGELCG